MTRDEMLALAERVERSEGADVDLNYDILAALGWYESDRMIFTPQHDRALRAPNFLGSIDDAMSLVPEGWIVKIEQFAKCWTAELASSPWYDDARKIGEGDAKTLALALTAAALRARAAQLGQEGEG